MPDPVIEVTVNNLRGLQGIQGIQGPQGENEIIVSDTAPASPTIEDLWIDESTGAMFYWTGSEWVEMFSLGAPNPTTAAAVSYDGGTGMSATNVEAAIDELANEKMNSISGVGTLSLKISGSNAVIGVNDSIGSSTASFDFLSNNIARVSLKYAALTDAWSLAQKSGVGTVVRTPVKLSTAGVLDLTEATSVLVPTATVDTNNTQVATTAYVKANRAAQALLDTSQFAPKASPTFTGNVVVPAADAAGEAAQVTAIDPTTGRLAIGGIEMGDTGWRDVSGSLATGWTGSMLLRRTANTTNLRWSGLAYSSGGNDNCITLPVGFRPAATAPITDYHGSYPYTLGGGSIGGDGAAYLQRNAVGSHSGSVVFTTKQAWPTSLPGTPA